MLPEITSPQNDVVRRLVGLGRSRERRAQARFLVEGRRAIDGLLNADWMPEQILWDPSRLTLPSHWPEACLRPVSDRVIDKISHQKSAAGVIAEFPMPTAPSMDPAAGGLVAVGLADPGNLGTLIRSAAAFGIQQVVCIGGVDPYGPKTIQATGGCLGHVRLRVLADHAEWDACAGGGAPLLGLVVTGGEAIGQTAWPAWLAVGGEADGLPEEMLTRCSQRVTLPMPGGTESLNAAIAGSLAAFLARGLHRA